MGRGCARHSFPRMQITSVYYFAGEKRREGGFVDLENNETNYFDCARLVETVGKIGQFFGHRRYISIL